MSRKLHIALAGWLGGSLILVSGCRNEPMPAGWQKSIPGTYEGSQGEYRESLEFRSDGTFTHEVAKGDRGLVAESGKWNVEPGKYVIELRPFSQVYDPMSRTSSTQAKPYVYYVYFPLPEANGFHKISASVEYEFCLTRKPTSKRKVVADRSETNEPPTAGLTNSAKR